METRVLVNGEWATRQVNMETVLRHYDNHDAQAGRKHSGGKAVEKPPFMGILTQTVVESPLVHHILPVKLRELEHNDVAFIGEEFVQIKELRSDGLLWDIARRSNIGARIRNACVVGSVEDYEDDIGALGHDGPFKYEGPILPPQFLMLQLDTGDSVFMMLEQHEARTPELVFTSRHRVMKPMLNMQPGMCLSVDSTSRYVTVGCSESQFSILELRSRRELQARYTQGLSMDHVKTDAYVPVQGVIQDMTFLYPSSDMVVLLVLVIAKGRTRMPIYEWSPGADVRHIQPLSSRGHLLPPQHQMPLLLIPLRFKSTFILVSENVMSIFTNILEGAPDCTPFYDRVEPPTEHHHGTSPPLWVSWARPAYRTPAHTDHRDDIYIVREDGLLKFLEIDNDDYVENDIGVGNFTGRCGTTLACIDYSTPDRVTGDLLITNGDSCSGGCYLVAARETPMLMQRIENWTPVQDIVSVSRTRHTSGPRSISSSESTISDPERLFACIGKGSKGAIAEFRHGIEAKIGLHFDFVTPVMQAWALPIDQITAGEFGGILLLLSIGASSVALHLASDESSVAQIEQDAIRLDLEQHTVSVAVVGDYVIQVTETSIVVLTKQSMTVYKADQLLHVQEHGNTVGLGKEIQLAVIDEDFTIYTTVVDDVTYLLGVLTIHKNGAATNDEELQDARSLTSFSGQVTALNSYRYLGKSFAVVAEYRSNDAISCLTFVALDNTSDSLVIKLSILPDELLHNSVIESVSVHRRDDDVLVVCGSKSGSIIQLFLDPQTSELKAWDSLRMGIGPVVIQNHGVDGPSNIFLATCDGRSFTFAVSKAPQSRVVKTNVHQIWYTDVLDPGLPPLNVTSIAGYSPTVAYAPSDRLLVVAGSRLFLTSVDTVPKTVPRYIMIEGTPTRMLYSKNLNALVVAASINNRSTILFLDPDTGEDLTCPLDSRGGSRAKYGSGLGKADERFFRLMEWKYQKDNKTWDFIIACTSAGKQLILSAEIKTSSTSGGISGGNSDFISSDSSRRRISYYTRHIFKSQEPIYSVAGFSQGLIWCAGEKLYCDVLELSDRKFRRIAEYELPSLARDIQYHNGKIYVLTQEHSLQVLELVQENDEYKIQHYSSDRLSRVSLDHAMIPLGDEVDDPLLHLVSDKFRSIVGLWPTIDRIVNTLEPVFEGQVPESILKFVSTSCRPLWDSSRLPKTAKQRIKLPPDASKSQELLGLSVCGSITRFSILPFDAWVFLRFMLDLCLRTKEICELSYDDRPLSLESVTEPKILRHIDGDILKRYLDGRKLEAMLATHRNTPGGSAVLIRFRELVTALHDKECFIGRTDDEAYIEQAYTDLEHYLRPVM